MIPLCVLIKYRNHNTMVQTKLNTHYQIKRKQVHSFSSFILISSFLHVTFTLSSSNVQIHFLLISTGWKGKQLEILDSQTQLTK